MTTYQDTFVGAGSLAGHVADLGFGTWANVPGKTNFRLSADRVVLERIAGNYETMNDVGISALAPYTGDADVYLDVSLPLGPDSDGHKLLFGHIATAQHLGFTHVGSNWTFWFLDGYLESGPTPPTGISATTPFRLGCYHDAVAQTIRLYSEPYGGGARTYISPAAGAVATWASIGRPRLYYQGWQNCAGGYVDNLTVITRDRPADPTTSTVTPGTDSLEADGVATTPLIVQLKDADGNDLTASSGTVSFAEPALGTITDLTDNGDGTWSATYTAGTLTGVETLQPALDGTPFTHTGTITLVAGPASAASSTVAAALATLPADGASTSALTVQLKDANGNNRASSGGVVVSFASPLVGTITGVTDNDDGTWTATYTAGTTAGAVTIAPKLDGTPFTHGTSIFLKTWADDAPVPGTFWVDDAPVAGTVWESA